MEALPPLPPEPEPMTATEMLALELNDAHRRRGVDWTDIAIELVRTTLDDRSAFSARWREAGAVKSADRLEQARRAILALAEAFRAEQGAIVRATLGPIL